MDPDIYSKMKQIRIYEKTKEKKISKIKIESFSKHFMISLYDARNARWRNFILQSRKSNVSIRRKNRKKPPNMKKIKQNNATKLNTKTFCPPKNPIWNKAIWQYE